MLIKLVVITSQYVPISNHHEVICQSYSNKSGKINFATLNILMKFTQGRLINSNI